MLNLTIGELYQLQLPTDDDFSTIWLWDVTNRWSVCLPTKPSPLTLLYLGLHQDLHHHFLVGTIPNYSANFPINCLLGSDTLAFVKPMSCF